MENLDEKMNEFLAEEMPTEAEGFVVDTAEKADWCIRKAVEANKRIEELKAYKQAKIEELNRFIEKENQQYQDTIGRMEYLLAPYVEAQLAGGKKRSLKLMNGSAGYRTAPAKFTFDDGTLLQWAKVAAPEVVKVEESVDWAKLKKTVQLKDDKVVSADGEVIPGVTVLEPAHDKFFIK